jgi:hypothetical protein
MPSRGWARCLDSVADILRRGAWYPIVDETPDDHVVVEVGAKPVRLSRNDVRIRQEPPDRWSVVVRTGVLRPTLGGSRTSLHSTYAVCPSCRERQEFTGRPESLKCLRCKKTAPIDWTETC